MSKPNRTAAGLELFAATGLVLSYIWLWESSFPGDFAVCLALFLAIALRGHRRRGETPRDLGFRLDNLRESAKLVFSIVVPLVVVMVIMGLALGLHREPPVPRLLTRVILMPLFGVAQQYALLGFYLRRFEEALPGYWLPVLGSATVFTLLHAPNSILMALTLVVSLGACWLYRRVPNLWVLGLAHGLLSITVAMFLAQLLIFGLKVGPRALR
jgi:membrane protease YdiL (CAAX protease family)